MVDDELKSYIHSLIKQGYDIETIKDTLIKAGHDINKIEELSIHVFEKCHKELIDYFEKELNKGRAVDEIKNELLKLGHSELKLKQVIKYHQKRAPIHKKALFSETLNREKVWFKSWIMIYLYLFIAVGVLFLVISLIIIKIDPISSPSSFDDRQKMCDKLLIEGDVLSEAYQTLCLAVIYETPGVCNELSDAVLQTQCHDAFFLYTFYENPDYKTCQSIMDPSLKEYCFQLHEKSCNNYFGYGMYCGSIVSNDLSVCASGNAPGAQMLGDCFDNFYIAKALKGEFGMCKEVNNPFISELCVALS